MTRVEYQSHFISGLMLVTKLGPGALEPLVTKAMADWSGFRKDLDEFRAGQSRLGARF
jgi:hypothetical protein